MEIFKIYKIPSFLLLRPPDSLILKTGAQFNFQNGPLGLPSPVYSSVPASSQGEVDDHVHGDQISHRVVVGSHGAQDPLPSLSAEKQRLTTTFLCGFF